MTALKLDKYGGMLPAWDDHLVPDGQASDAVNGYLFSGALIGWRRPKLLRQLVNSAAGFVFRVVNKASNNTTILAADSTWLEFTDQDTNVLRTPIVNDQFNRHYFASPSTQPQYNTYDRLVAGQVPWLLGVPAPGCAPGVVVVGGGDTAQLGNPTSVSNNTVSPSGNNLILVPVIPKAAMALNDVAFQPLNSDPNVRFASLLYADQAGSPGTLLNAGDIVTSITAGSNASSPFVNPTTLVANTRYWIGVMFDSVISFPYANDLVGTSIVKTSPFSNGPPAAMSGGGLYPNLQIWGDMSTGSVLAARAYVYTWITSYGEEGPPSPPTLTNGWSNGTWTLSLFMPPLTDQGVVAGAQRFIVKKRIYRTISAVGGNTTYFFVAEIPVTDATYVDVVGDDIIAINEQLGSTLWFPPPVDLQGFAAMPNGFFVGFRANELWFTEAYHPHAWPPSYVLTTEFPIVGIGVAGQSCIVCTEGKPYIALGVDPSAMSLTKVDIPEPCLSRASIVVSDLGVMYQSANGLIQVTTTGQATNITEGWITRERWAALTPQKFTRAIKLASSYFAFGSVSGVDNSVAQQGFTLELTAIDKASFTIWPQPGGHRLGFMPLSAPGSLDIVNVEVDPWTGTGLLIQNGGVYYYDFTDVAPEIIPCRWVSKIYQHGAKQNYAVFRVFYKVPPGTPAQSPTRNVNPIQTLASNQYAIVRVYAKRDDNFELVTTREVRVNGELLRINSGFKTEEWKFEIEGRVQVSNLQIATTVKELAKV